MPDYMPINLRPQSMSDFFSALLFLLGPFCIIQMQNADAELGLSRVGMHAEHALLVNFDTRKKAFGLVPLGDRDFHTLTLLGACGACSVTKL